jgi:hypothetical protein
MSLWTSTDEQAGKPLYDNGADVFGIDGTEIGVDTSDNVVAVTIVSGGIGYTAGDLVFTGGTVGTAAAGTYTVDGSGAIQTVTLTGGGDTYTSAPTIEGNLVGGATFAVSLGEGAVNITHTGWNKRTTGSGGRVGRVFWECLVAGGISGDAEEIAAPDA